MIKNKLAVLLSFALLVLIAGGFLLFQNMKTSKIPPITKNKPESVKVEEGNSDTSLSSRLKGIENWQRPDGPPRVAIQVGHWKASEAPDELENLRVNTGTSSAGSTELEVAMAIAERTKSILEEKGVEVEILPVTIPPNYWADVFVSIHADGNDNSLVSGYKIASPRWDYTGRADAFAEMLDEEYGRVTKMHRDPSITKSMEGYYAFNWLRYKHSLHPMTVAAIVETGFLTNPSDRRVIVSMPEKPALGIANSILHFFSTETAKGKIHNNDI